MGTYNNLDKKSKTIVDTGLLLGILSDLGTGLTFIAYETGDKLFPKIYVDTKGGAKLVHLVRNDGFTFRFNLILTASAQNTVGINTDMYGLVRLDTYKQEGRDSKLISSRTLTHYYLQEGFEHNLVPLKHTIGVLSKHNILPDRPLELLPSMIPALVKAVGLGPEVVEKNKNYFSKLYLLQDEFYGLGIMKRK